MLFEDDCVEEVFAKQVVGWRVVLVISLSRVEVVL